MYTSGSTGKAYALDAKTGKELWSFDPHADLRVNRAACCDEVNRGVAVWHGKVYVASFDGILYALDAATGKILWHADTITDKKIGYSVTGAPEVAGHVVVIGNAGAEYDARGYVSAYDLDTGKFAWRFYTVPGDPSKPQESPELEVAVKTWDAKSRWDMGGGATVWDSMVYDPELNLLYFGTGNGTFFDQSRRSPSGGDNLYIASILAINPDTGRLVWHYQEVPGDQWDYDTLQPIILTDLKIGGASRKVLMQASKDGFFYIIDRKIGPTSLRRKIRAGHLGRARRSENRPPHRSRGRARLQKRVQWQELRPSCIDGRAQLESDVLRSQNRAGLYPGNRKRRDRDFHRQDVSARLGSGSQQHCLGRALRRLVGSRRRLIDRRRPGLSRQRSGTLHRLRLRHRKETERYRRRFDHHRRADEL